MGLTGNPYELASVKLFLEVVEAGSLSKVAARRQTVQSHISRQISDFESGIRRTAVPPHRPGRGARPNWVRARPRGCVPGCRRPSGLRGTARGVGQAAGRGAAGHHPFGRASADDSAVRAPAGRAPGHPPEHRRGSGHRTRRDARQRRGRPGDPVPLPPPERRAKKNCCASRTPFWCPRPGDALTREPTVNFSRLSGLAWCCLDGPATGAMRSTKRRAAWASS